MKIKYFLLCVPFLFSVGCQEINLSSAEISAPETSEISAPVIPQTSEQAQTETVIQPTESASLLQSPDDINIYDANGMGENYIFSYDNQNFQAFYSYDNWKIIDSYKIRNNDDIRIICQALKDIHPVHSADMSCYRDADDMAYEWIQHNIAYDVLPDDSEWKSSAKDVDINPDDQNKNLYDMFLERQDIFSSYSEKPSF